MEQGEAARSRDVDHGVGALGRPADAQHGVAVREQTLGDRMEDLVERRVAGARALRYGDQDHQRCDARHVERVRDRDPTVGTS
jgi:hypothetical protein